MPITTKVVNSNPVHGEVYLIQHHVVKFIEYSSPIHALEAVKMANGYKLDKLHTFAVNLFSDFDKLVYTMTTVFTN
jgi:hypothetical protein